MTRLTAPFLAAAMLPLMSPAVGQDGLDTMAVQFGAVTFSFYCTTCHGEAGAGDGPAAEALAVHPADLTMLAGNNGGTFPEDRVRAAIDGRAEVVGHVEVAMPPWGRLFSYELNEFEEGTIRDAIISRRIDHIIAYLKSIQQ